LARPGDDASMIGVRSEPGVSLAALIGVLRARPTKILDLSRPEVTQPAMPAFELLDHAMLL